MNETPAARDEALIEKEAVGWFTRMNGKPSRADRRHFKDWLDVEEHRLAYEHVAVLWSSLGMVADNEIQADMAAAVKRIEERRRKRLSRKVAPVTACGLAVIAAGFIWLEAPNFVQDLRADYVTARGERRELLLADGTHVVLDADSALSVSITHDARTVRLLRGTAYFEVTHSPVRFTVEAQDGRVEVLGTRFEVAETPEQAVSVALFEGSLAVDLTQGRGNALLHPGEQVAYGPAGMGVVKQFDADEAASWRNGRFVFADARLKDVIAEIARYYPGRVLILGDALGNKRISGTISLDKPEEAMASLQSSVGFRLSRLGSRLALVSP